VIQGIFVAFMMEVKIHILHISLSVNQTSGGLLLFPGTEGREGP